MSPRSRMLEILAAANLAPQQLAMTQANAQRDVANTQAWSSLAPLLVNTATQGIGTYQKSVADDADTAARKAALDQLSTTGEHALLPGAEYGAQPDMRDPTAYAQSPADVAKQAVDSNKDLNPGKPTGFFDSIGNLLGDKEAALAKARVNAQGLITNEVQSNRDKATALARQQQLDAQTKSTADAENALRTQETATQKANAETEAKKLQLESDKTDAEMNLKGFEEEDKRAALAKMADKSHPSGGLSAKEKAAADKAATAANVQQQQIAKAKRLQEIYEGGTLSQFGGYAPDALKDPLRVEAEQLAHELALGVPSAFSGSNRLNQVEFKSALGDIIGAPDSADTNEHKAQRARDLADQLSAMVGGAPGVATVAGAMADQPRPSAGATISIAPPSMSAARVTVTNGKETYSIPRAQLANALADGFRAVP